MSLAGTFPWMAPEVKKKTYKIDIFYILYLCFCNDFELLYTELFLPHVILQTILSCLEFA